MSRKILVVGFRLVDAGKTTLCKALIHGFKKAGVTLVPFKPHSGISYWSQFDTFQRSLTMSALVSNDIIELEAAACAAETIVCRHVAFLCADRSVSMALHYRADDHNILTLFFSGAALPMAASYIIDRVGRENAHIRMSDSAFWSSILYAAIGIVIFALLVVLEEDRYSIVDDRFLTTSFPAIFYISQILTGVAIGLSVWWVVDAIRAGDRDTP
jgi:hypothetical protein